MEDESLNIKNLIKTLKELYNSNLFLENILDVLLTTGTLSFCYNFFSKAGLIFVVTSAFFYITKVPLNICLSVLFTPSILILLNVPIVYGINIVKILRKNKQNNVNKISNSYISNDKKEIKDNFKTNNLLNENTNHLQKSMVRVRKK